MKALSHNAPSVKKGLLYFAVPLLLAAAATGTIIAVRAQQGGDPEAGLTDAQREAIHAQGRQVTAQRQAAVNQHFVAGHISVSDLPRVSSLASFLPSQYDLGSATAHAPAIARGIITGQYIVTVAGNPAAARVVSTIAVDQWLKGTDRRSQIELEQFGMPALQDDGSYVLVTDDDDPIYQDGTEVILFADKEESPGRYTAIPYKTMRVLSGSVVPNPLDAKASGVDHRPVSGVIAAIMADVQGADTPVN